MSSPALVFKPSPCQRETFVTWSATPSGGHPHSFETALLRPLVGIPSPLRQP